MCASSHERVVVAMSGGVDSSVAAARLVAQGHTVVGVTLRLPEYGVSDAAGRRCCGPAGADDARHVAETLGIPFYVLDYRDVFEATVVDAFCRAYLEGRTPNPCADCNTWIKFGRLQEYTRELGFDALATGHYARIEAHGSRWALCVAADASQDQSYFLAHLAQEPLRQTRFPLGQLSKTEVRAMAATLGLRVSDKPASQDICFLRDGNYRNLLRERYPDALVPGEIVDMTGHVLGTHDGLADYTIGQRRGLGVATGEPAYVVGMDASTRRLVIGPREALDCRMFRVEQLNWIRSAPATAPFTCMARTRHRQACFPVTLDPDGDGGARVTADDPVPRPAPGQSAVFYDGDHVVAGGIIGHEDGPSE